MSYYRSVFENEFFIVVDKSANVLSVPGRLNDQDPRPVLGRLIEIDLGIKIYPIHRLDFEVSGLIMFAKTTEAHRTGNRWFEKHEVHKTYQAITKPNSNAGAGEFKIGEPLLWKCKLLRGKKRAYESPVGKACETSACLKKIENGRYFWELNPITGRSHQLRYELFRHGHSILGDQLYSSEDNYEKEGIALRAFKIDFTKASDAKKFHLPDLIEIN